MKNDHNFAKVKVENEQHKIIVPISSEKKPEIPDIIKEKWQQILDLIAEVLEVPSSLIMKIEHEKINVFLSGRTEVTPYRENESENLGLGLYCETVIGKREELLVPNALKSEYWKDNPDIKLHMISYLGLPIKWSDGEIFGTFCVLDSKENKYSLQYRNLLKHFKDIVESDMVQLQTILYLESNISKHDLKIREIHHNIKNQFNMLISLIDLEKMKIESDKDFLSNLNEISNRIHAMSHLHKSLYMSVDAHTSSLKEYLTETSNVIIKNFSQSIIEWFVDGDNFNVNSEVLLSCGLLISELMTNSIKHAFKDIALPKISIIIKEENKEYFKLIYSDNGVGFNKEDFLNKENSLGSILIAALTEQLQGELIIVSEEGASFEFRLKH